MSNVGKWDSFYVDVETPEPYGDTESYVAGARALSECKTVEDWGCGLGWFRRYIDPDRYIGVDGSTSKFADVVADLHTYRSSVEGVFMRHVLEHNYHWPAILDNALASFTKRFVLVTFTPWTEQSPHQELRFEDAYDVPTLALNYDLLINHLSGYRVAVEGFESPATFYGHETMFTIGPL